MRAIHSLLLCSLMIFAPAGAALAETVGYAKTVEGRATLVRQGQERTLVSGAALEQGDIVRTEAGSSVGITMRDGTTLSAGPDTELILDHYAWGPTETDPGFVARVSQGTLDFVSGLLGKTSPESVAVVTPTGVIGLRGTHFVVKVKPGQEFDEDVLRLASVRGK
jgi:hypothetical protein